MPAFVDHKFDKGFLLDEERIRKLHSILLDRARQLDDQCKPMYQVYRSDAFTYTTEDLEDILAEDNTKWQRLDRLTVLMESKDSLSFELNFDQEETRLYIAGKDRDLIFLISSDVRQYLTSEVNVVRVQPRKIVRGITFVLLFLTLIWLLVFVALSYFRPHSTRLSYEEAVASHDVEVMLNYLVEWHKPSPLESYKPYTGVCILMIVTFALMVFRTWLYRMISYFYPRNVFVIGREVGQQARRQSLRHNLLWGVIISLVVGIVGGLLVWLVTK